MSASEMKAKVIKVPYDVDGNKGITFKVALETSYGLMKFKIMATPNEKLVLATIASEEETEEE